MDAAFQRTFAASLHHIAGYDRSQTLLLPESLDEYVGPENPVRFIEAVVDGLDLTAAGFARVTPKVTGRPGYAPADLLKCYIYGYLKPDFKTIADFRRDNASAFRPVFRQFVLLCRQLDLFGRELIAVDGTRITAIRHNDRPWRNMLCLPIRLRDYAGLPNQSLRAGWEPLRIS